MRFTGEFLTDGVGRHRIEGVEVAITDPARTIVDCFRYRAKVGPDAAMERMRDSLRRRRCTPDELWRHARKARLVGDAASYRGDGIRCRVNPPTSALRCGQRLLARARADWSDFQIPLNLRAFRYHPC